MQLTTPQQLLKEGKSWTEIMTLTGLSRSGIAYHAKKLKLGISIKKKPILDWDKIGKYSKTHTVRECCKKFGFTTQSWTKAVKRNDVPSRKNVWVKKLKSVMTKNSKYSRGTLKSRLIKEGVLENRCNNCGIKPTWNGKVLVLVLDHINGVRNDHRFSNLRLLCPNCNSQTETFCGKNVKR